MGIKLTASCLNAKTLQTELYIFSKTMQFCLDLHYHYFYFVVIVSHAACTKFETLAQAVFFLSTLVSVHTTRLCPYGGSLQHPWFSSPRAMYQPTRQNFFVPEHIKLLKSVIHHWFWEIKTAISFYHT